MSVQNPLFTGAGDDILGMRFVVSPLAVTKAKKPAFPVSRHRSQRIHKKLEKKYGPQWPMVPAAFQTPFGYIVHPAIADTLRRAVR